MKKKLLALALILALAVSALGLAACGGTDFSKTYDNPYENKDFAAAFEDEKVLTAQTNLNLDFETEYGASRNSNLCVFNKEDTDTNLVTYKVYSFETDSVIATFADTADTEKTVTYDAVYAGSFFVKGEYHDVILTVKTTDPAEGDSTTEFTLYNADGTLVGTSEAMPVLEIDTIFLDNDYYRLNKAGKFEKAGSRAKNAVALPDFNEYGLLLNGNYYYVNNVENIFYVYNDSFVLTNYYELPSYADLVFYGVLNDGNILIQYKYVVAENDTDYTYYDGGDKFKVITQIYDVKKNEAKEIETVCIFDNLIARDSEPYGSDIKYSYGNSVENYVELYYITNQRIDDNYKVVSLKNDGTVDKILNNLFIAQDEDNPEPLASGKFVVSIKDGSKYLVSEKGNIIADITGAYYNNKYIVLDGKIYDHDFKEIETYDDKIWDVKGAMNNSIVFELKDNEDPDYGKKFKLFADGAFKDVTLGEGETLATTWTDDTSRYYVVKKVADETTTYTYYNESGVAVLTSSVRLYYKGTARNGKLLLSGYDAANEKNVNVVLYTAETK